METSQANNGENDEKSWAHDGKMMETVDWNRDFTDTAHHWGTCPVNQRKWGTWVISPANNGENGWFLWIYSWWMEQLSLPESIMPWTHSNPTKNQ
jgi:hypothetical protein